MENLSDKQKKYLKKFWIIFLSPILIFILLLFAIAMGWLGYMPNFAELENPNKDLASEVISDDGKILGTFYLDENRNMVEYKDLSPYLVQALIAREDHRFKKHSGIDGLGLSRVIGKTIILGKSNQGGGSTITQQLAKNLFQRDTTDYKFGFVKKFILAMTKFREWVIAVKLERNYSKDEIISMYFNTVPFGPESYGIKTAARTYFNKPVDSLKIEESAMLVAMLKGNTKYNPMRNPEKAIQRRNDVLQKMYEHDYINKKQLDSLTLIPLKVDYHPQAHDAGIATYFREFIRKMMKKSKPERKNYFNYKSFQEDSLRWTDDPLYGWCNKNLKPDGTSYNLYKDGLKIYTTINYRMQDYAELAVKEHLSKTVQPTFYKEKKGRKKGPYASDLPDTEIQKSLTLSMKQSDRYKRLKNAGLTEKEIIKNFKIPVDMSLFSWNGDRDTTLSPWDSIRYYKYFLRASFMAVDPHTGFVKAYVGGPEYKHFQYDGVTTQKRQVGSTIKPFLYTLAMQEGYKPCDKVLNVEVSFFVGDTTWTPKNAAPDPKHDGKMVTLKWGLANSVNNISAYLIDKLNPQPVVELIKRMGVKSEVPPVYSLCLGTPELSLYELVGAYTTYPNKGVYTQPIFLKKIEDKNGNLLTSVQPQKIEAISEHTAYLMIQMLRQVVLGGTAARLNITYKFNNYAIGGKTGTTDNNSDGWFVGVTPNLVAGAWVGGEEPSIHFDNMKFGEGAAVALPIFALFMQKVYADKKFDYAKDAFEAPANFNVNFDCPVDDANEEVKKEYLNNW